MLELNDRDHINTNNCHLKRYALEKQNEVSFVLSTRKMQKPLPKREVQFAISAMGFFKNYYCYKTEHFDSCQYYHVNMTKITI